MNVGFQIDLVGWFALALILAGLYGLNSEKGELGANTGWYKLAIGLLSAALLLMLVSVLWTSDGSNVLLAVVMVLLGVVSAPLSSRYRATRRGAAQEGILSGLSLIIIGTGLSVALLGLTGWFEADRVALSWDIRLVSVSSEFIGVWTFAAGLMLWLRLNDYLPQSNPGRHQKWIGLVVLAIALGLSGLSVIYPAYASVLMIVVALLALELGALSALGVAETRAARVLGQHMGLIGAAIAMLGYVQASLFLLSLGGLIVAAAIHYLRGAVAFNQAQRRRTDY
jgi:H+-translocating NAD(P) transhydrogenase subunit beta